MVRKVMGAGTRARYTYDPESEEDDAAGDAGGSDDGFSSPPELPSDEDSDYNVSSSSKKKKKKASPKKASPKKKKGKQTPRGKISPAKTPASKRKAKYNYAEDSDDLFDEEEEEEPAPAKRGRKKKPAAKRSINFDEYDDDDLPPAKKAKKKGHSPAKGQKAKKKAAASSAAPSRSSSRSPAKKPVRYNYDDDDSDDVENGVDDDDDSVEEEEEVDSDDYEPAPKKSHKKKKSPAKKGRGRPPASHKKKARSSFYNQESEDESEEDDSEAEARYQPKKGKYLKAKKQMKRSAPPPPPKFKLPKVSEMVVESIKALKDKPTKGSTLGSIKETILLNWSVNMNVYDGKIKKFITNAIETGEIIQTKGKGFRGRFTVPGMKIRRKKARKNALGKKFDEDEVEYQPAKTQRAEDKEKNKQEIEEQREQRRILQEKKLEEKANLPPKPKRPPVDPNKEWEVEAIKGMRERKDGDVEYLVKWIGWPKPTWEKEENVEGCADLIDAYMIIKEKKEKEKDEYKKLAEEEGHYEVAKLMNMRVKKNGQKEFLVRWKGFGAEDDTWEPEEHLDCTDLIAKCEKEHALLLSTGGKRLREAPKPVQRLEFASSKRDFKKRGGFRISYVGMDD